MRGVARIALTALGATLATPGLATDLPTKKPTPVLEPAPVIPSAWRFEFTG
jgi:hypothetical protein